MPVQCSVLVNTASRPEHLDRCLGCYPRQTRLDFEMVIADDGSDAETLAVVERHRARAPFPIVHVWQPFEGHRRAAILNKAIAACRTDYILFTDCDALAPAHFVATHLERRRARRLLVGGRIKLKHKATLALTDEDIASGVFESLATASDKRRLRWEHLKNTFYIWIGTHGRPHNLALNMSVEKSALEAINGYDNAFRGWGNADGDLRERLRMNGVRCLSICSEALVYHQSHPQPDRSEANRRYAQRADAPMRAQDGLAEAAREYEAHDRAAFEAFRASVLRP
jgi:glycosyltransferase involved in cell wall biosynthesis